MPESTHDIQKARTGDSPPTVAVLSLGCRANQEEVECILGALRERGFRLTDFGGPADWVVINTCSVTRAGESDTRQMIRKAVRRSGGRVVVTGCFAQMDPDGAAGLGADLVVGNRDKWRLPDLIASAAARTKACTEILFEPDPTTQRFLRHGSLASGYRTRAALKIQDGCDERCTYCIIPSLRGRSVSRDPVEVLDQAGALVAAGHPEITLTGIHSASYRWGDENLASLLRRLLDVPDLRRIRINSLEPQWVDPGLIEVIASSPRFARHLHLPLQSGDPGVLKKMGRGYSPDDYRRVVDRARMSIPGVAIGADVMVGFPGEDDAAFERSLALLEAVRPAYLHVFPYSARPGTAAVRMGGSVDARTARARAGRLALLDRELRAAFLQRSEGEEHEILLESKRNGDGRASGRTDTFIRVAVATDRPAGSWIRVRLRWIGDPLRMVGEAIA